MRIEREGYGITVEQYEKILGDQGGKCAICGRDDADDIMGKRMPIDHDHETNEIVGRFVDTVTEM